MKKKYTYAISACLCGVNCRYDGKSKPNKEVTELYNQGDAILICPEQAGGLSVPRPPCEIKNGRIISKNGQDLTEAYLRGSQKVLEKCLEYGVEKAILKQNSPSCGTKHIYDGTFRGKLIDGEGVTAKLLRENGIEVFGEDDFVKKD
ncbi:MAG: DUF523 domain-containing protein [Acutalibacteraceae bacterium]